jgi:hypothetical protein
MSAPRWLGPALAAMIVAGASLRAPASLAAGQKLGLTAGLSSAYDSNLLQYSPEQLTLFDGGTKPDRFSIQTRDDLVWNPSAALLWEIDQGHGRRHALRLRGEGNFHQENGTADYRAGSVSWRESFRGERRLALGYYLLPHYYLRQLLAEDVVPTFPGLSKYRRAQFDLGIASASWSQRVAREQQVEVAYQFERRRYVAEFRERDSDTHQGEITWGVSSLPNRGAIQLGALYRKSVAKASDGDEVAGVPPDDADVSYHGLGGQLSGRLEFGRRGRGRFLGDLGYEIAARHYDSGRPADKYHFGRNDLLNAFEVGLRCQYRPHWAARGFYRYETNDAKLGSAAPASADAGSYRQHQVGLSLEWSGDVWRSRASGSSGEE